MTHDFPRARIGLGGALSAASILALLAACSFAGTSVPLPSQVQAESLTPADAIPLPSGEVILTVGGDIDNTNAGATVTLDMATLERLGLVKYRVHDPWLDEEHEFTGVLLSDLLQTVGTSADASVIHLVALDDYAVDISIADAQRWPILLATRTNGEHMSLEEMGPTRIVFPYDQFPEIDRLKYKDLWIWLIESIEVR